MRANGLTDEQDDWAKAYIHRGVDGGVLAKSHDEILGYAGGCGDAYRTERHIEPPEEIWHASHAYMLMAVDERNRPTADIACVCLALRGFLGTNEMSHHEDCPRRVTTP